MRECLYRKKENFNLWNRSDLLSDYTQEVARVIKQYKQNME